MRLGRGGGLAPCTGQHASACWWTRRTASHMHKAACQCMHALVDQTHREPAILETRSTRCMMKGLSLQLLIGHGRPPLHFPARLSLTLACRHLGRQCCLCSQRAALCDCSRQRTWNCKRAHLPCRLWGSSRCGSVQQDSCAAATGKHLPPAGGMTSTAGTQVLLRRQAAGVLAIAGPVGPQAVAAAHC